ncbi:hypothetical protein CONLIGDRAFT_648955 [Coniochaeta ligniaria NRRL 30616]|uniref:Uncharacterized protein n=1 Tax=Coniochaeta ligniaria NRRL 30616 TaxID=1408157 RepID=A0A1J7J9F5_9PEZI|nr:hypothetical protein CONLIGDRAFT_648955 [Coniochaeta ligniaria NRRL 30616]
MAEYGSSSPSTHRIPMTEGYTTWSNYVKSSDKASRPKRVAVDERSGPGSGRTGSQARPEQANDKKNEPPRKKDEDHTVHDTKLAATAEPLGEAAKFHALLLQFSPNSIEAKIRYSSGGVCLPKVIAHVIL